MILVDANLLLYAYDSSSPQHARARRWLEATLSGDEEVRIPLISALAFLRIGTHPAVFQRPLGVVEAVAIVTEWLERPMVELAQPTSRHWTLLASLARDGQARGALMSDAHLATLTMEHGGVLCTTDRGFARFDGLKFRNPLTPDNA